MALPATEAFTGTAGVLGASWTQQVAAGTVNRNGSGSGILSVGAAELYAFWNADAFATDQYSQVAIVSGLSSGAAFAEVSVRASGSGASFNNYNFVTDGVSGSGHSEVYKWVAGAQSLKGSIATTVTSGDVIKIDCVGTLMTVYKNGVSVGTFTDSSLTSGSPGIGGFGTSQLIDNWQGDNVGATVATGGGFIPLAMAGTVPNDARYRAMRTMAAYSSTNPAAPSIATIYFRRTFDLGNASGVGSRRAIH